MAAKNFRGEKHLLTAFFTTDEKFFQIISGQKIFLASTGNFFITDFFKKFGKRLTNDRRQRTVPGRLEILKVQKRFIGFENLS